MCERHLGGTGLKGMKVSWKAAEVLHYARPGKTIGEGAVSVSAEGPGLKGSCKEVREPCRGYW